MSAHDEALLGIAAARLWAAHRFPYFTTALFALVPVVEPDIGTVAVDRHWRLYADPEVVAGMDVSRLGVLLVHHVGHLLRQHAGRAESAGIGEDRAAAWNDACDAEINDDLAAEALPSPKASSIPPVPGGPPDSWPSRTWPGFGSDRPARTGIGTAAAGPTGGPDPGSTAGDGTPAVSASDAVLLRRRTAEAVAAHVRAAGRVPGRPTALGRRPRLAGGGLAAGAGRRGPARPQTGRRVRRLHLRPALPTSDLPRRCGPARHLPTRSRGRRRRRHLSVDGSRHAPHRPGRGRGDPGGRRLGGAPADRPQLRHRGGRRIAGHPSVEGRADRRWRYGHGRRTRRRSGISGHALRSWSC